MSFSGINLKNPCVCGKNHDCVTKNITIGENISDALWEFQKSEFGNNARGCYISDFNTAKIAHDDMRHYSVGVTLDIKSHHADEYMIEMCEDALKDLNYDYFIACGSGTIHDITRFVAHKYNKPFISYPTAPSVDGFTSAIAPVTTKDGMKATFYAVAPVALFADINVLANAPKRLVASGVGDIIGKYTALADWRISNLLTGEHICEPIVETVYGAVKKVTASLAVYNKNKSGESYKKLCADLLESLVVSGLCMQYLGNSRPASGAEHHVAHFFEMNILLSTDCLHGENVGVGSILCAELYRKTAQSENIKFNVGDGVLDVPLLKKYYKDIYGEIIKENEPDVIKEITPEIFYNNLDKIKSIVATIPKKEEFEGLLDIVGGVKDLKGVKPYDLKCGENEIEPLALKLAPYIRGRFTLLKLMRCIEL